MGRMELRHLRTIAAVARHGSFSKAAEELHLAQSAVSQQIRRFEQELGVEVFRRSSRSVEITPEGEVILGYAHRVLREVDGLHGELQELTGLVRRNTSMPSSSSRRRICCETADCARCSSVAAFEKEPWRATAAIVRR